MKQNKYWIAILLMALVIAGCSPTTPTPAQATPTSVPTPAELAPTPAPQDDSWVKVQQAGVLRVGTTADYPPFEYINENVEMDGFDIALIRKIGEKLGLQVELNNFPFQSLPATVDIGQVDVAIAALSVTPERQAIVNFSNVYYTGSDAVLSRPEADPNAIKDTEALAAARLGVQVNSIYETYAQEKLFDTGLMPKQKLNVYPDINQAVNALKSRQIDAVWMDLKPAQEYANAGGVKILVQGMNQQLYAIGMKKGADALRDKINEALTQLNNDGTLANLQVKYLGIKPEDVVTPQPPPTPIPQPTPVPPACQNHAEWVKDLSYDDQDHKKPPKLNPGQPFTKGWRIRNIGTCTWKRGYMLAYSYGMQMGGQPIPVTRDVKQGEMFDFQVNLIAPIVPGRYEGYWNMRDAQNNKFGEDVWVDIIVASVATPTSIPTPIPVADIDFRADPTTIMAGQSVLFKWMTVNAKSVSFYHDGQNWWEHPVPVSGQQPEYPQVSMSYHLRVVQADDSVVDWPIPITVNFAGNAPEIQLGASPQQVTVDQLVNVDWFIDGMVDHVSLLVDNVVVLEEAPIQGNYPDYPKAAGTRLYTLQATGSGGHIYTAQASVNVQPQPPTPTPVPDVPTETPVPPTPTPEPTEPQPEPPVIQGFDVMPTTIEQGQCVTVSWTTGGGTTRVELSRDADVIWTGPDLNGSIPDCNLPEGASVVQYTVVAYNNAEEFDAWDATVQVVPAPPQNPLANTSWQLQSMQGADVPPDVSITAYFSADGGLSGSAGCNSYSTSYVADGQVITIYAPGTAGALCGEPLDSLERTYLELLPQAANFETPGGQLILRGNAGQQILLFNQIG